MSARIDLCLVESWSPVGFEHGVFATALSLQKSFNWMLKRSFGGSLKWMQRCI